MGSKYFSIPKHRRLHWCFGMDKKFNHILNCAYDYFYTFGSKIIRVYTGTQRQYGTIVHWTQLEIHGFKYTYISDERMVHQTKWYHSSIVLRKVHRQKPMCYITKSFQMIYSNLWHTMLIRISGIRPWLNQWCPKVPCQVIPLTQPNSLDNNTIPILG